MLDEKQIKMIKRYCIYPSLAIAFLIVCLSIGLLWLILVMLGDLVFKSTTFYGIGIGVYLGIVLVYLILFIYFFLSARIGTGKRKWLEIEEMADLKLANKDYSDSIRTLIGARATSTLLDMSNNSNLEHVSDALDVVSAIGSVAVVASMTKGLSRRAKIVARVFDIEIPKARKYIFAIAIIPIILLIATYVPHYVFSINQANEQALVASKSVYAIKESFESDCLEVRMEDPLEKYNENGYYVSAYLYDYSKEYNSYINVSVDNEGEIEEVTYTIDINIDDTKENNIQRAKRDIIKLNKMLCNSNVKTKNDEMLEENELPKEFCEKFKTGSYYETIRYEISKNADVHYLTDTKEDFNEYSSPCIYFVIDESNY